MMMEFFTTRSFLLAGLTAACLMAASAASALEFNSDFSNFESDWLLESGSEVVQTPTSLTLSAAPVSPKQRGRILIRPILSTTPDEILDLVFTLEATQVSAPLAARVFYYDENRNYLDSDPLFGTTTAGTIVASGRVLTPHLDAAGIRVRLYSNAPTGSVTFTSFGIQTVSSPVPEPGTALLLGLGLVGLIVCRDERGVRSA